MYGARKARLVLAAPGLAAPLCVAASAAQHVDLNRYLVGKWHQDVGNMSAETVFNPNQTFTSLAWTRGTPYRTGRRGEWEIRNEDELWLHNFDCSPNRCPVEWENTRIEPIDENHFRNRFGDVYRMR
jgi:hypothetical protein